MGLRVRDPAKYVAKLDDNWENWPPEAIILLNEELDRLQRDKDVSSVFNLVLHPAQQRIIAEAKRFNVADCGRRFGKSILGQWLIVQTLLRGEPCSWMSPSYRSLGDAWRDLKTILAPITVEKNEQERRLVVNTGGVLECWSLENPDAPRGRKYKRVVVDEAAMVRYLGEAWEAVIKPTLLDLLGDAWFLSTPKGANFFKTMFSWGQDAARYPDWMSWCMPTTANSTIPHLPAEIEKEKKEKPERIFRQEYLAEFIDDAGGVFRGVDQCATLDYVGDGPYYVADYEGDQLQARDIDPDHQYVIGVDWGKHNDFTVLAVVDVVARQLVALDRFNQIDYTLQLKRLKSLARRFGTKTLIPERNSIGEPLIEQLKLDGFKVHAWTATNASKAEAVDSLSLAFEKQELAIMRIPVLVDELQAYEAERLPSGLLRYSAPEGYHDDCVMALALAWQGAQVRKVVEEDCYSVSWVTY